MRTALYKCTYIFQKVSFLTLITGIVNAIKRPFVPHAKIEQRGNVVLKKKRDEQMCRFYR